MSFRFLTSLITAVILSSLNALYACEMNDDLTNIHEGAGLTFLQMRGYTPETLPLSFFEELATSGKTTRGDITYSVEDPSVIQKALPTNLLISDRLLGQREKLEIKCSTLQPLVCSEDPSKINLKYVYLGRYGSGQQEFVFQAHLQDVEDEKYVQQWTKTLQGIRVYHQEEDSLIATLTIEKEPGEEEDSPSFIEKVKTAVKFVAPYVANDIGQSLAPSLVPTEILVGLNTLSAGAGFDTPLHALLPQDPSQETENDPLDQRRKVLTKKSEAIGAALTLVPGATQLRTAINLACQYGGYDSLTHLINGVPSQQNGNTEEDHFKRKINLAKGAARLAIIMFVPGGKFVVIGSKIYEFTQGKSVTETVINKISSPPHN